MKIGVISDTHGYLDPLVLRQFSAVEHILHAGDVGSRQVVADLQALAPVTVVAGNNDDPEDFPEVECVELGGVRFMACHIVDPRAPSQRVARALLAHAPMAVVFGHTHRRFAERIDGRFYLNPGYSGRPRLNLSRSVAIAQALNGEVSVQFLLLDSA